MTDIANSAFGRRPVLLAGLSLAAATLGSFGSLNARASHAAPGDAAGSIGDPGQVYTVPDAVDGTGAADATIALTAWLDSLPEGSIADLGGKAFLCETSIRLIDKVGLTIRNGTLSRADWENHGGVVYPRPNPHLWLLRPTRCRVENLTVTGTNAATDSRAFPWAGYYNATYEFEAAVRFEKFIDCSAVDVIANRVWGDGIQAHGGVGMLIDGLTVVRNGRQGITPQGRNFVIRNCDITARRAGIDMEPNSDSDLFGNVLIENNKIRSRLLAITAGGKGEFSGVEIRNNTIVQSGIPCINGVSTHGGRRDRWHVHHNRIGGSGWAMGSPQPGIRFAKSEGTVIEYNHTVHGSRNSPERRTAVGISGGSEVTVRHNWFENAATVVLDGDGTCTWLEEGNHTGSEPPPGWWE